MCVCAILKIPNKKMQHKKRQIFDVDDDSNVDAAVAIECGEFSRLLCFFVHFPFMSIHSCVRISTNLHCAQAA